MYKATAAVIFAVIAALIVLVTVSTVRERGEDDTIDLEPAFRPAEQTAGESVKLPDTAASANAVNTAPVTAQQTVPPAESTATGSAKDSAEVTTKPAAQVSTPTTSAAPAVNAPAANTDSDWADFLAKYPDTVLAQSDDAGQDYIDKLVFLGDSTTYGLRAYKMLSGGKQTTQVWTPESGTLTLSQASFATIVYPETNAQITIKEAVKAKQPEYLVVTLGVNGVSFMDEEYFKSEYKKLLLSIIEASPETKIICQSIFPVARTYKSLGSINNDKIRAANRWILETAAEVGVKFIDTYSVLCDSEGWLPEEYHNGDGMHLNSESFTLELNNLRTHAYTG